MARRFRSQLHPVQRIKHVIDLSQVLAKATTLPLTLIEAKDAPVIANVREVVTGSQVHGIYLKVEVASNDAQDLGAIPNVYMAVYKNQSDALGSIVPNTVGGNVLKKFVIHQEMIMIQNTGQGGVPRILFNGVIKIPKGYSRFGPDDRLTITILSPQLDTVSCLQCHYKEFR